MITTEFDEWMKIKMFKTECDKWENAEYPYDLAECGFCFTYHAFVYSWSCHNAEHDEMRQEATELITGMERETRDMLYDNPEKFRHLVLAFRKKFAKFYKKENNDD
jgi:hypothetical protein